MANEHVPEYMLDDFSGKFQVFARRVWFFSSSVHLMVRNSASATDYHLHGVSTFTVKIKRYACVCATTSDVCEAALEEVS